MTETKTGNDGRAWNIDGARIRWGRWDGYALNEVPPNYLRWAITHDIDARIMLPRERPIQSIPFYEAAAAELLRRGERLPEVEVTTAAVDSFTLIPGALALWERERNTDAGKPIEGIARYLERIAATLLEWNAAEIAETRRGLPRADVWISGYGGVFWRINITGGVPVLERVSNRPFTA